MNIVSKKVKWMEFKIKYIGLAAYLLKMLFSIVQVVNIVVGHGA